MLPNPLKYQIFQGYLPMSEHQHNHQSCCDTVVQCATECEKGADSCIRNARMCASVPRLCGHLLDLC